MITDNGTMIINEKDGLKYTPITEVIGINPVIVDGHIQLGDIGYKVNEKIIKSNGELATGRDIKFSLDKDQVIKLGISEEEYEIAKSLFIKVQNAFIKALWVAEDNGNS